MSSEPKPFPNAAGRDDTVLDAELRHELQTAGIKPVTLPECVRDSRGEVRSIVLGSLHGWTFERYWCYWVCKGPGIEVEEAEKLHATHGQQVRVAGHCGCPSPREWYKGLAVGDYHVDTPDGLKALADTIKRIVAEHGPQTEDPPADGA